MNWWAPRSARGRWARAGTGAGPAPGRVTQRRVRAGTSVADEGSRPPLLPVRTPEGVGRRSAGGYRIAVEGHRWRPADEQERSRLTRIAVDRGAEPQTVPVISGSSHLDGPGRPGAGRSSCRCCAVMVVTRLKDAVAAVSRICGRGSPIPIFAQVRGILTIVMHRCAAAIGSAHRRAPRRRRSVPSGPGPTAWWSLVIDSTCQVCATQPRPVLPQRFQACRHTPTGRTCPPTPRPLPHPPVGLIFTPSPRHPPALSGLPPMLTGTFHAARCVSLQAGAFDAVGDSNPVPTRATRPRPEEIVPARAGCPHMPASSRRHGVRWSCPMPRAFR